MGLFLARLLLPLSTMALSLLMKSSENAFAAFDRNANLLKWNTKTKLKSKPKKNNRKRNRVSSINYPQISMCFFYFLLLFLFECHCPMGLIFV